MKLIRRFLEWFRAVKRAARYNRQRDVLDKHLCILQEKYCLFKPMSKDLIKVLDEIMEER
jgi:hypothetical protein